MSTSLDPQPHLHETANFVRHYKLESVRPYGCPTTGRFGFLICGFCLIMLILDLWVLFDYVSFEYVGIVSIYGSLFMLVFDTLIQ